MSRLTRDGTAEPVSRDQTLRRGRGQGNFHFPCSVDHEQDKQPSYPVDPCSCYMCDHTYINEHVVKIEVQLCFFSISVWIYIDNRSRLDENVKQYLGEIENGVFF